MQCASDPSPTCMGGCARSEPQKSLQDLVVRPYCNSCAEQPTRACWEKCYKTERTAREMETPAVYCMQCASDPSPTCMGACGLAVVMTEFESPTSFCMQCASDPSPT